MWMVAEAGEASRSVCCSVLVLSGNGDAIALTVSVPGETGPDMISLDVTHVFVSAMLLPRILSKSVAP